MRLTMLLMTLCLTLMMIVSENSVQSSILKIKFSVGQREAIRHSMSKRRAARQAVPSNACQDYEQVTMDEIEQLSNPIGFNNETVKPWLNSGVKVFKSNAAKVLIEDFYATNIPVPSVERTFRGFLDDLLQEKCLSFMFGGAVRDIFLSSDPHPNDFDVISSCSTSKIITDVLIKHYSLSSGQGYWETTCGGKEYIVLDGEANDTPSTKELCNTNPDDIDPEKYDLSQYDSLFLDPVDKSKLEYTSNSIAYDLNKVNNIIIDITGSGVEDTCKKKIRIPVSFNEFEDWSDPNVQTGFSNKVFRYFKLRVKGYEPVDDKTQELVIAKAKRLIATDDTDPFVFFHCQYAIKGERKELNTSLSSSTQLSKYRCVLESCQSYCEEKLNAVKKYYIKYREDFQQDYWTDKLRESICSIQECPVTTCKLKIPNDDECYSFIESSISNPSSSSLPIATTSPTSGSGCGEYLEVTLISVCMLMASLVVGFSN